MNIYQKIWKNRLEIWLIFFLLLAVSSASSDEAGRPAISLYYYESEGRILMCVSGKDENKQGVLFTLENGQLHGMEPRRPKYEEDETGQVIISKPANPDLVAFQRILLGLGKLDPLLDYLVKPLQKTIGALKQDGTVDGIWGDKTWIKLFKHIRDRNYKKGTDDEGTADLQLGKNWVRVYRLDTIVQNRADSKEKKHLKKLLQDSSKEKVKSKSFPKNLVKAYTDLINAPTPAVTSGKGTPSKQSEQTRVEKGQPEKKVFPWGWVIYPIISIIIAIILAFLVFEIRRGVKKIDEREDAILYHLDRIYPLSRNDLPQQPLDEQNRTIVDIVERNRQEPTLLSLAESIRKIKEGVSGIQGDVKNIRETGIPTNVDEQEIANSVVNELRRDKIVGDFLGKIDGIKTQQKILLDKQKALGDNIILLRELFRNSFNVEKERVSADTLSEYSEILQSHLESLYAQRLMQRATPEDKEPAKFSHLWFLIESWKLSSKDKDRLPGLLERLQDELIEIEPELKELRNQICPRIIEFADKNTLQDYLKSYQEARNRIEQFEPPSIPIVEDKLVQLQNDIIIPFIGRLYEKQIGSEEKIEAMLRLVSLPTKQDIFEFYDNFDDFQKHLGLLYEQKLAEVASPNEKTPDDVSRVWFFIELWKVKVEEPLKSLLSEFQEQMKRISPELENYSFEKPDLGEKPNLGQGDFAALKEYLSLYQQKKQSLQDTPFDELPIQPEKRRRLQRAACRFVDRIYECGGATKHKIEVFLSLVGLGELFIKVGYTPFYEVFHETVDRRREPSLARGTIVEVIQRGFFDRTTGEIVQKASVITAE